MQKSKSATIIIMAIILCYGIFATFNLSVHIGTVYLYILNPIFWITIALGSKILIGNNINNGKIKTKAVQYAVIAGLIYVITSMLSGLVVSFGKNPYNTSIKGLLINFWIFGSVIIAKEYIRVQLVNNVSEKDKIKFAVILSIIYIFIEIEIGTLLASNMSVETFVKFIAQSFIPIIAKNVLYSYSAIHCGIKPALIYEGITNIYLWIAPILPNMPWILYSILNTVIPVILYLYLKFAKSQVEVRKNKYTIDSLDPKGMIGLVVVIVIVILFALGIFPIKPVSIASASMEKELFIGDVAFIKKCKSNDINVGDIIEYKMDGFTVIHRVIKKTQRKGEFYFITKGDNNKSPDREEVREKQLIGKVVYKIRYIGYPAVWLHNIQTNKLETGIEMGK